MITQAIHNLRPNTEWTLNGDDVENIIWHTKGVQPLTVAEVQAEVARLEAAEPLRIAIENRKQAYRAESDPVYFQWQRGEATEQEWLDAVQAIKARYPKPT